MEQRSMAASVPQHESEKPVLITFAVKEEMKFFEGSPGVRRYITGMGRDNAEQAVSHALQEISPRLVLTCGFAGGLNPALKNNEVVFHADEGTPLDQKLRDSGASRAKKIYARRSGSSRIARWKICRWISTR
jgi:hypothetical protein